MAAKVEKLRNIGFVRPAARPIIRLKPGEVKAFITADEPECYWVVVTPEVAQAFLDLMGPNRNLKPGKCDGIMRDMMTKHFYKTNIGIGCNILGQVFDAQNRLTALVRSGETQEMLVVIGLPVEAQGVIDCGTLRSYKDELRIKEIPNSSLLAASLQWIYNFEMSRPDPDKKVSEQRMRVRPASLSELRVLKEKHEFLAQSCTLGEKLRSSHRRLIGESNNLLPMSLPVAVHYVGSRLQMEPDKADEFLERIIKWPVGYESKTDPIFQWCRHLNNHKTLNPRHRSGRIYKMIGIIRTWNFFREEKPMEKWQEVNFQSFQKLDYDLL